MSEMWVAIATKFLINTREEVKTAVIVWSIKYMLNCHNHVVDMFIIHVVPELGVILPPFLLGHPKMLRSVNSVHHF
jgi:hypothetical protein